MTSGSMEPAFYRGDLLFLTNPSYEKYRTGDITVYKIPGADIPIVHRVMETHDLSTTLKIPGLDKKAPGDQLLLTKGDNNPVDDIDLYQGLDWLEQKHIVGKVRGHSRFLPYVGYVTIAMRVSVTPCRASSKSKLWQATAAIPMTMLYPETHIRTTKVDGLEIFYREAGSKDAPVVLLLHGFPSSSHQFRDLLTRLAGNYRVIAPDLPGFGFTRVPESRNYQYTFENLTKTVEAFVDDLGLHKYAIYIFDYGAPVGLRLALSRPSAITAIVSQNGNAFEAGLGDFWNVIRVYWVDPTPENGKNLEFLTKFETTKSQYESGEAHPERIPPETYHLDQALMDRPGNKDIQLDLFYDYRTNVTLYPAFHEFLREHQPPVLAIWGKNDAIFIPPGAEAFKSVVPKTEVHFVDGGHFALENHLDEISSRIVDFLKRNGI
ncbi:hypothetical protein D9757_000967 [Collybiopsis confluens]|uniref:Signal peptidase complex catalytic subunit SEC11 n=1 Tax=Collybiopsis confluens TaxID=2823264 RepID=A0A8H5I075_9AGAR|nr:hypothetical protein D9757_000967 [Collybiopsis confluens]